MVAQRQFYLALPYILKFMARGSMLLMHYKCTERRICVFWNMHYITHTFFHVSFLF